MRLDSSLVATSTRLPLDRAHEAHFVAETAAHYPLGNLGDVKARAALLAFGDLDSLTETRRRTRRGSMSTAGTSRRGSRHPDGGEDVPFGGLSSAERAVVCGPRATVRSLRPSGHRLAPSALSRRQRPHTHCACNGVLLCRADHQWAYANPDEAR